MRRLGLGLLAPADRRCRVSGCRSARRPLPDPRGLERRHSARCRSSVRRARPAASWLISSTPGSSRAACWLCGAPPARRSFCRRPGAARARWRGFPRPGRVSPGPRAARTSSRCDGDGRWSREPGLLPTQGRHGMAGTAADEELHQRLRRGCWRLSRHARSLPGRGAGPGAGDGPSARLLLLPGRAAAPRRAAGLRSGSARAESRAWRRLLREIGPVFERSDVYAQLLRLRLYAAALGSCAARSTPRRNKRPPRSEASSSMTQTRASTAASASAARRAR